MIQLPIEIGDILLGGRFKNHKITVKEISYDEYGSPTINGRSILKVRIPKLYQNQSQGKKEIKENKMRLNESTNIDLGRTKYKYDKDKRTFYFNEKDVKFDTDYVVSNPKSGKSLDFRFKESTGPEFDPNTEYIYVNKENNLTLIVTNDPVITQHRADSYLTAKTRRESNSGNKMVTEGPAQNNPKIQKIVDELNKIIESAKDSDGDPIGVVDTSSSWQEPYVYQPIQYKNGALKITCQSQYKNKPEVEIISKRNMEFDGIPTLKNILKMYRKAMKESGKPMNNFHEGKLTLTKLQNLVRSTIKEFREPGNKVVIKNDDNQWWIWLQTPDGEECINNVGYKTEELADYAAFMKGFEVVDSKGKKKRIGFDELPDTRLPPKGTAAEPVKHEEPKYIDLGSEKKIKLENFIRKIIKEEKKRLFEIEVTDPDLISKIEEMAKLSDEMDRLSNELSKLKEKLAPLDDEITKLMEAADQAGEKALETKNVLVTIKKRGYESQSIKYKELFDTLYKKVNAAMKKQIDEIRTANTTMKKYAPAIAVQYKKNEINEESVISRLLSKLKNYFSNFWIKLDTQNKQIDANINALKRMI